MSTVWVWDGADVTLLANILDDGSFLICRSVLQPTELVTLPGVRLWTGSYPAYELHGVHPMTLHPGLATMAIQCQWAGHCVTIMTEPSWSPESQRYFTLHGSDVIVTPFMADRAQHGPLWRDAQQNQYVGLSLWPTPQLTLPCEITEDNTGIRPGLLIKPGLWRLEWAWSELATAREIFAVLPYLRQDVYRRHPWWNS